MSHSRCSSGCHCVLRTVAYNFNCIAARYNNPNRDKGESVNNHGREELVNLAQYCQSPGRDEADPWTQLPGTSQPQCNAAIRRRRISCHRVCRRCLDLSHSYTSPPLPYLPLAPGVMRKNRTPRVVANWRGGAFVPNHGCKHRPAPGLSQQIICLGGGDRPGLARVTLAPRDPGCCCQDRPTHTAAARLAVCLLLPTYLAAPSSPASAH